MKNLKSKLQNAGYFRNIPAADFKKILDRFNSEISSPSSDADSIFLKYKLRLTSEYKLDVLKLGLFVINLMLLASSLIIPIAFFFKLTFLFAASTYALYGLYIVLAVLLIVGFVSKRIKIKEYKYHLFLFSAHFLFTVVGTTSVFYAIANALSKF